jgi:hypothetical protein
MPPSTARRGTGLVLDVSLLDGLVLDVSVPDVLVLAVVMMGFLSSQ